MQPGMDFRVVASLLFFREFSPQFVTLLLNPQMFLWFFLFFFGAKKKINLLNTPFQQ